MTRVAVILELLVACRHEEFAERITRMGLPQRTREPIRASHRQRPIARVDVIGSIERSCLARRWATMPAVHPGMMTLSASGLAQSHTCHSNREVQSGLPLHAQWLQHNRFVRPTD